MDLLHFHEGLLYTMNGNRLEGLIYNIFPLMLVAYYTEIIQSQSRLGFFCFVVREQKDVFISVKL